MNPGSQITKAFRGVLVETSLGPLANGRLDEAFGLATGAWSVDAGAGTSELEIATGLGEEGGTEAGAVVGHDATDRDAEVGEVGHGLAEEAAGGSGFFIGQQSGKSDAGMVIDGDIKKLPAGTAGFILGIAGEAMAGLVNAGQLLDVDVQPVARSGQFAAHDGRAGSSILIWFSLSRVRMRLTTQRQAVERCRSLYTIPTILDLKAGTNEESPTRFDHSW